MTEARELFERSRPRFWLYLAGPVLVGAAYGAETTAALLSPLVVALFAYFLVPANVFLYGVNDVFDADVDRTNPKKDGPEIRYRGNLLTPIAVVTSALAGLGLLVVLPATATPYLVGFLVLGTVYSAPPLRLKTKPPLDSISNGLYVLPGATTYATLTSQHPPLLVVLGAWIWTMAMHTFSAVPDVEPDREAGITTTATVLGRRGALAYCVACWVGAAVLFGLVDLRAGGLMLAYPVLVVGILASDVDVDRAYWWYPTINVAVGAAFTLFGLWWRFYA